MIFSSGSLSFAKGLLLQAAVEAYSFLRIGMPVLAVSSTL